MKEPKGSKTTKTARAPEEDLSALWDEHVRHEFATHDTEETLATMVEDAYVNHIPVLTGGVGKQQFAGVLLEALYSPDAARYGDGSDLAHYWPRSVRG
jgi:hypothetical protein